MGKYCYDNHGAGWFVIHLAVSEKGYEVCFPLDPAYPNNLMEVAKSEEHARQIAESYVARFGGQFVNMRKK